MGINFGPTFESFNQGLKIYGFETQDIDIVFTINSSSFSVITSGTCTYNVYWGDGTNETVNASGTFTKSHSYSSSGIYNVGIDVVSGTFRPYYNNNSNGDKITRIRGKYNTVIGNGSFQNAFYGSANLEEFTVDLSGVTSLYNAFLSCPNLDYFNNTPASITLQRPLFNFRDLSNVTDARGAFCGTGSLVFNGFNLSGLSGDQDNNASPDGGFNSPGFQRGIFGAPGSSIPSSTVVSIGSSTEPIGFGTAGGNTFGLRNFAYNCNLLQQVYFDSGVKITTLYDAFLECEQLNIFEVLDKDLSNVTSAIGAFCDTGSLVFNGFNLSGLSGDQDNNASPDGGFNSVGFQRGIFGAPGSSIPSSSVVSIGSSAEPIGFGTTGGNTFGLRNFAYNCNLLTQVYFDSGVKITTLYDAFLSCGNLTTFEVLDKDLSNVTSAIGAFCGTKSLVFNGFNLSGLSGDQDNNASPDGGFNSPGFQRGIFGAPGSSIPSSSVVSIGSSTEPIGFGTTGGNTFGLEDFAYDCNSLTQVYFDSGVKITRLYDAFLECEQLNIFEVLDKDLSNVTYMPGAFCDTGSLVFNGFNLSGLSGAQDTNANPDGGSPSVNYQRGIFGAPGSNIPSSSVVSIGSSTEPIGFGTTGGNTFGLEDFAYDCNSLTQVYFDSGVKITRLYDAFLSCGNLTTFEVLDKDLSNVTYMPGAFCGTKSLVFNGFNLSGLSGDQDTTANPDGGSPSVNYQRGIFGAPGSNIPSSSVVSIGSSAEPIGFGTTGGNTFGLRNFAYDCNSLQQVYFDSGVKITTLYDAFLSCGNLTTFEVLDKDLSNVTSAIGAFCGAGSIVFNGFNLSGLSGAQDTNANPDGGFPSVNYQRGIFGAPGSNIPSSSVVSIGSSTEPIGFGTTGGNTFGLEDFAYDCNSLTQVYFDSGVKITSLIESFYSCGSLTTFRNQDSATGFTTITNMSGAFQSCALDADSIENILVSCDNGGKSSVVLNINGGSNAAYSTWSGIATQALSNLQGKSWTISYNT